MLNPTNWVQDTLFVMTSMLLIINVINAVIGVFDRARKPETIQNDRINDLDKEIREIRLKLEEFERYFTNDDNRIKELESGNRVTQSALLALMRNALDGNNREQLRTASNELDDYLTGKTRHQHMR